MDDVPFCLDGGLDFPAELDEAPDERRLDGQPEAVRRNNGVERAAVGDRNLDLSATNGHGDCVEQHKARDVFESHGANPSSVHGGNRFQATRGDVDHDVDQWTDGGDHGRVDRPGYQRDRAVAAGRAVPRVMEEDHPKLGALVFWLGDKTAIHVGVPTWLEDEELADLVEVIERVAPLLEDGPSAQERDTTADDAEGFAGGVVVHRAHQQAAAGRRFAHRFMLTQPDF